MSRWSSETLLKYSEMFRGTFKANVLKWLKKATNVFENEGKSIFDIYKDEELDPLGVCEIYGGILEGFQNGGKLLDIGCGTCIVLSFLTEASPFGIEPFGLEQSPKKVDFAKKTFLSGFKCNILCRNYTTAKDITFREQFDVIIVSIPDEKLLEDLPLIERMVRPGGKIFYNMYGDTPTRILEKITKRDYKKFPRLANKSFTDRSIYFKTI